MGCLFYVKCFIYSILVNHQYSYAAYRITIKYIAKTARVLRFWAMLSYSELNYPYSHLELHIHKLNQYMFEIYKKRMQEVVAIENQYYIQ